MDKKISIFAAGKPAIFNIYTEDCSTVFANMYALYHVEVYLQASGSLYLIVTQLKPRLLPIGKDLPQDDAKAPDVAFRGEFPVHDALGGHPADR